MTTDPRRTRYPLRLKLSIMAGLLTVLPLMAVGLALVNINVREVRNRIREFQIMVADDTAHAVGMTLRSAEEGLAAIALTLTDRSAPESSRLLNALALLGAHRTLDLVGVYGADGVLIDVMGEVEGREMPELVPEALRRRADTEPLAVGAALRLDTVRVPMLMRLEAHGRTTGYLLSRVPLHAVQARVERLTVAHFRGLPDPLLVVDIDRRVIARGQPSAGPLLATAPSSALLTALDPAAMQAGLSAAQDFVDAEGREMVGAAVWVKDYPWAVVVQQPRDVVYGVIDTIRLSVVAVIAGAILVALLVAIVVARRISEPLHRLAAFAGDLAARRFDTQLVVNTQDELAILGDALSGAAADLKASEARIVEELAIRTDLGRYLPGELVEKVVRREQDMGLGGRRTPISVLFADVVAFTPLTEKLPPEEVVTVLNELFTILTEIIFRHGGTVDKFVGDCVMAMWGAPRPQADHATRALAAAEDMMRWLEIGNANWQQRFGVELQLAIGVNSGEAVVGNIGSETRMEYTAIGDVVNVAARLESIARPMQILVSEPTRRAAGDAFDFVSLGARELSGRSEPIHLFEVRL